MPCTRFVVMLFTIVAPCLLMFYIHIVAGRRTLSLDSSVQISMGLVRHRAGKALALQFMLQTAVFGMLFATVVRKLRPQHRFILSNTLSVSPSAEQFAENCAFWLVEAALDSLIDELATISHYNLVIQ